MLHGGNHLGPLRYSVEAVIRLIRFCADVGIRLLHGAGHDRADALAAGIALDRQARVTAAE